MVRAETGFVLSEKFKATIIDDTGNSEILEDVSANALVNQYLPMKIREYFFFDGEQLHNYFGAKSNSIHVKDSIHQIAQVNVLINIKTHLQVFIKGYQKTLSKINPEIDNIAGKHEKCKEELNNVEREINDLQEAIDLSKEIIADNNAKIAGTETAVEDNNKLQKNEAKLAVLKNEKIVTTNKIKKLVHKYSLLLYMYEINKFTYEYIDEKFKKGALPPAVNGDLLKKSLHDKYCALCSQKIQGNVGEYIREMLDKIDVGTETSHKLTEIKNDIYFALEETKKYKTEKEELVSRLRRIDKEVEQLEDENIELNKNIVKFSKIEDIEMWIQQRKENKELLESNIEKIGSCKERKNNILKRRNDLEEEMKKVLEQVEKSNEIKRYLDFCSNAYGIFNETEQEIVDEVRIQIETLTFDLFKKLDWRAEEYGHLELNSNYKLKLFYKDTQYSCLGSCSAAERLLMALAFTIAIHQVSGHNCLLFIDSPVGRVSDINRTNFAKSLIRTSEFKQIILAFTPSEYSEEISDLFNSTVVASRRELVAESMHYEED